jgi:hypothetical protein
MLDDLKERQELLFRIEIFPAIPQDSPPRIKAMSDGMRVALTNASERKQVDTENNECIATIFPICRAPPKSVAAGRDCEESCRVGPVPGRYPSEPFFKLPGDDKVPLDLDFATAE